MTVAEQGMSALEHANEVRFAKARLKRELQASTKHDALHRVAELLADPPPEVCASNVAELLLTARQRGVLADRLSENTTKETR